MQAGVLLGTAGLEACALKPAIPSPMRHEARLHMHLKQ